jgi:hypothetical protein
MARPDTELFVEMLDYSARNYPMAVMAAPRCGCGGEAFRLAVDDAEGAAVRTCVACGDVHPIADSAYYLDDAELEQCECPCGKDVFMLRVGVAVFRGSRDSRWVYIGLSCLSCHLAGVYADWKLDGDPSHAYLKDA